MGHDDGYGPGILWLGFFEPVGRPPVCGRVLAWRAGYPVVGAAGRRGRCYLPLPVETVLGAGPTPRDHEVVGSTVKASEVALARLLQGLGGLPESEFDSYLEQTGAHVVPDGDLG